MALDINGYNADFNAFVKFAQDRIQTDKKAVVRFGDGASPVLGGRTITAADPKVDKVGKFRTQEQRDINNAIRTVFRDAVIDMFGGESRIPDSVKKAMLLADYDKGKPLTARRIMAVKIAIDASGVAKARSAQLKLETFVSPEVETAALGMGYMKSELPKLARAAHFYAEAKNVSEMEAMREVGRPGSEANRLMNYGGRFLENAANFQDGLRLISQFSDWHDGLSDPNSAKDTLSKINVDVRAGTRAAKFGLERFLFEDIATNPNFNLAELDSERAFGVEHNMASRFMTTASNTSTLGTIANVPPEKRRVVYAAFNAFSTLATTEAGRGQRNQVTQESIFLARVIKNLPKLEAIMAKTGTLTGKDVIKNCFPDIRHPGNYDASTIKAWEQGLSDTILRNYGEGTAATMGLLESAGATYREAVDAVTHGKKLPCIPYYSDAQYSIEEASSVATSGLATMNRDICRLSTYATGKDGNSHAVFNVDDHAWKFNFPDGEHLETNGTKQNDIPRVGEKIRQLCGEVHQKQIGAVAFMLSQSGTSVLLEQPLAKYGIATNEHSPVDFTLSRNDETGTVTITYTSPKELPVKFSWTATVDIDGTVASTPLTIT